MGYTAIASRKIDGDMFHGTYEYYCSYCNHVFGAEKGSCMSIPSSMMQLANNHICEAKKKDIDNTPVIPAPDHKYCPKCHEKIRVFNTETGKAVECFWCGWENK
jgi:hypothetical protein